jgi:protein-S-isoprenylcysteine O-methyltransferase Ste14
MHDGALMKPFVSTAGYIAVVCVMLFSSILAYLKLQDSIPEVSPLQLFSMIGVTFTCMLLWEYISKTKYNRLHHITSSFHALSSSNFHILKSTLFRWISLFIPFYIGYFILTHHFYFIHNQAFAPTILLFGLFLKIMLFISPLYIFVTLKFRGQYHYEFNDYALLTLIGLKSLACTIFCKKPVASFYKNRRVKKVFLVYLVNFFFITLMARFLVQEYHGFEQMLHTLFSDSFAKMHWYDKARNTYFLLFHSLFLVDVSIATIGYAFASRWLNNRTKSVDFTLSGWMVAIICYPPFNSFLSGNFISYNTPATHAIITSQAAWAFIFVLLILAYTIYVWGTVALGFKFSNLTNRGIITTGPYRFVRHPAYAAKNFAWLIDNTYVFTNIWATLAFFAWNGIYILRGLTEERHLSHDASYRDYTQTVTYRFIPKII